LKITLIGTIAGVLGTGIGGIIGVLIGRPSQRFLGVIMGFSGGLMLSIVFFGLIPEALRLSDIIYCLIGIAIGTLMISLADFITSLRSGNLIGDIGRYRKIGLLLGIGIALHNFPEGLAIGAGFASAKEYGLGLALIFSLHNAPEGMAMTIPLMISGKTSRQVIAIAAIAGAPMGLGAFIGNLLGWISPQLISLCLGFAAGAMLYITTSEIIPGSIALDIEGNMPKYGIIVGIIVGILISMILG
jgi:ZIP family zinc transporter